MMTLINIAVVLSIVLNGGLLIYLFGALPFFLFFSVVINFVFIAYTIYAARLNAKLEQDLQEIYDQIDDFTNHVENLHSLEMYYGDQNLQNLIDHSRQLINSIVDFQVEYSQAEVEIEPDTDKEEETTETEE
jgi:hypothetical protein